MDDTGQPGLGTARIVASALAGGLAAFWVVAWVLTDGGEAGIAPDSLPAWLALWIVAGALLLGFVGALFFRGKVVPSDGTTARRRGEYAIDASTVQTNLIIAWALLESPALLGAVLFLLLAENPILWITLPIYAVGVAITFPRAEWFGEDEVRRADPG